MCNGNCEHCQNCGHEEEVKIKIHPAKAIQALINGEILYINDEFVTAFLRLVDGYLVIYGLLLDEPVRKILGYARSFPLLLKGANELVPVNVINIREFVEPSDDEMEATDEELFKQLESDLEQIILDAKVLNAVDNTVLEANPLLINKKQLEGLIEDVQDVGVQRKEI